MNQPPSRPGRSGLFERLGTYVLGVAIGCMLVMVLLQVRRAMLATPQPQPPAPAAPSGPAPSAPTVK